MPPDFRLRRLYEERHKREKEYNRLVRLYCAPSSDDDLWAESKIRPRYLPRQGFKLHVSSTIICANEVFSACAQFLSSEAVFFKVVKNLELLARLNSGLYFGFSQVGKFITVYPTENGQAVQVANRLHQLTEDYSFAVIPFDKQLRQGSCVFYRYGAFFSDEGSAGGSHDLLYTPSGRRVPDRRVYGHAVPPWVQDPFSRPSIDREKPRRFERYRPFDALSQRGKGGVYRALDLSTLPLREVVLKEGRRNGEVELDGRDGYWRVANEYKALVVLAQEALPVPCVVDLFEQDEAKYLVLENIAGVNLDMHLRRSRRKLGFKEFLNLSCQVATIVDAIHRAGWAWRDCKPLNLIVQPNGELVAIDFEGACRIESSGETPWGSMGYKPVTWTDLAVDPRQDDLFALGATLHHMATGDPLFDLYRRTDIFSVRRGYSKRVKQLVYDLTAASRDSRPSTSNVLNMLLAETKCLAEGSTGNFRGGSNPSVGSVF